MDRMAKLKQMIESEPDDTFLNFSLAMEYQSSGKTDEAIAQYDRTVAIDPHYMAAHLRKGELLMANHRYDEARQALEAGALVAREANDNHMLDNINELISHLP